MDFLNRIILLMNEHELRFFKLYASRIGATEHGRKDTRLFDYIKKSGADYDDDKIFKQLYKTADKNSFYRLKNHLSDELNKCNLIHYINNDDAISIHALIALARVYLIKNNYDITHHFLKKAEKKAIELEQYELLDSIYAEFVKLSHLFNLINPEKYIDRREQNLKKVNMLRHLDNVLAVLNFRLQQTQNFSKSDYSITDEVNKVIKVFAKDDEAVTSTKFRFRVYEVVSQTLLQQRNYVALEKCVDETYRQFLTENLFTRSNHHEKIQMLIFLANAYFKNKKYEQSLETAQKINDALKEFGKRNHDKYIFYYYNSLVMNYSQTDKDKAIEILNTMSQHAVISKNNYYPLFITISLAVLWFEKKCYKDAIRSIIQMNTLASFKKMDADFRLKVAIAEIIIRIEMRQTDLVTSRIVSIKKVFKELLKQAQYDYEKQFLTILSALNRNPSIIRNKDFLANITQFCNNQSSTQTDEQFIPYNQWLMSKAYNKV